MTASTASVNGKGDQCKGAGCCAFSGNANWSGINIAAMVIGFVLFWPLGLFVLYWIFRGGSVTEIPGYLQDKWRGFKGKQGAESEGTDNQVFNEYQQTQYDRIREIKDEIKERTRRFTEFRSVARRRADEEEFRRFMDDSPS